MAVRGTRSVSSSPDNGDGEWDPDRAGYLSLFLLFFLRGGGLLLRVNVASDSKDNFRPNATGVVEKKNEKGRKKKNSTQASRKKEPRNA